jgi:hypothetical protein
MKRILTIFLALGVALSATSQDYTVTPEPPFAYVDTTETQEEYYYDIVNNLDSELALSWTLLENTLLDDWTYNLCDYLSCFLQFDLPNANDMELIPPLQSTGVNMKLGINTNGIAGHGIMRVLMFPTGSPEDGDTLTFDITCLGTPQNIGINNAGSLSIYPVPAKDRLIIDFESSTSSSEHMRIYNSRGSLMRIIPLASVENQLILDVSTYPAGIYILKLAGVEENIFRMVLIN